MLCVRHATEKGVIVVLAGYADNKIHDSASWQPRTWVTSRQGRAQCWCRLVKSTGLTKGRFLQIVQGSDCKHLCSKRAASLLTALCKVENGHANYGIFCILVVVTSLAADFLQGTHFVRTDTWALAVHLHCACMYW